MTNTRADTDRALSYIDTMRGNSLGPQAGGGYGPSGGAAYGTLSRLMGFGGGDAGPSIGGGVAGAAMRAGGTPQPGTAMPGSQMFLGPGVTRQMVMLEAPNGHRREVPADHVDHYLQRGARVIQ
jgi:hypothetical protein